ncbi:hypothetical protein [Bacillus sp. PF5]|nr:hypothetical protein [Bacillus sp. PF5]
MYGDPSYNITSNTVLIPVIAPKEMKPAIQSYLMYCSVNATEFFTPN